jgi:acetoin utilization protein AcuA
LSEVIPLDIGLDMPDVRKVHETDKGDVVIIPRCPPGVFPHLRLDSGLGQFSHYASIIQKLDVFQEVASGKDGRVCTALVDGNAIAGYGACWYPGKGDRWSKLGELCYEMGALEVSRNFRGMGLGKTIFDTLMEDDFYEDKIAYMNGFSWHWDLDGTGLTMVEYRRALMGLLKAHGFKECITNEPNIALREENFFMARIGSRVSEEDQKKFRNLRFGILP